MKILKTTAILALASASVLSLNGLSQALAQSKKPAIEQVQPNKKMLEKGKKLFAQCAACHGTTGKGDGPGGAAFNPKPRNFHANEGWINGRSFAGLYKTLEEGLPGTGMSAYTHLSAADRVALINHLRTLSDYPKITADDIKKLEKDFALSKALADSANKKVPLNVEAAIKKLTAEAHAENKKAAGILKSVKGSSEAGAQLFKKLSNNQQKAIITLIHSKAWKSNVADFSKVVLSNVGHNGFKAQLGRLSKSDWQVLFTYLKKVVA